MIRSVMGVAAIYIQSFLAGLASAEPALPEGPDARAERMLNVLDVILEHHVAPQTIQQMLLDGVLAISHDPILDSRDEKKDAVDDRPALAKEISSLSGRDALKSFLSTRLAQARTATGLSFENIEERFLSGVARSTSSLPGSRSMNYIPAKQYVVEKQLRENRYVGIGIALSISEEQPTPTMQQVFPRGPAHAAGGQAGDLILSIDNQDTKGMKLTEVIEKLRGQAGQPVSVVVRQPNSDQTRTLNMVRGEVPMETVVGRTQTTPIDWDFRAEPGSDIAYIQIKSIRGSTTRELKETAGKLHPMNFRAIMLDLTTVEDGELRHATMIADQLLGKGPIGSLVSRGKKQEFVSDGDRLFAGMPMAVLVGPQSGGQAEWIAAAIQDQHCGFLVGSPTSGTGYLIESIQLPNGDAVTIPTGKLLRANGKSLVSDVPTPPLWPIIPRRGMPAPSTQELLVKTQPGWHGVFPDHQAVPPLTPIPIALVKLKEQLSTQQEPATQ